MAPTTLAQLYHEASSYYAFASPEAVKTAVLHVLDENNITNFDSFLAMLKFCLIVANNHLLNTLTHRYSDRNPTAGSIMGPIARLELRERRERDN